MGRITFVASDLALKAISQGFVFVFACLVCFFFFSFCIKICLHNLKICVCVWVCEHASVCVSVCAWVCVSGCMHVCHSSSYQKHSNTETDSIEARLLLKSGNFGCNVHRSREVNCRLGEEISKLYFSFSNNTLMLFLHSVSEEKTAKVHQIWMIFVW